jgi:hypothetical protein
LNELRRLENAREALTELQRNRPTGSDIFNGLFDRFLSQADGDRLLEAFCDVEKQLAGAVHR